MKTKSVLWLLLVGTVFADTMKLKDGNSMTGNWLGSDAQQVKFAAGDQVRTYPLRDVQSVVFGDGGAVPTASPIVREPLRPRPPVLQEEVEGFTFRLDRCEKHGGASVTCYFTAVNHKADRPLGIYATSAYYRESQMIDSAGVLQKCKVAQIGSARSGDYASTELVSEVAVKGLMEFGGVDPNVQSIAKLTLLILTKTVDQEKHFFVSFRSIPLVSTSN